MNISSRQYSIIKFLRSKIIPVPGNVICDELDISTRTLRYDVSEINNVLGVKLILSGNSGYYIDSRIHYNDGLALIDEVEKEDFSDQLAVILVDKGTASVYELEEMFYCSSSTINLMLPKIRKYLKRFNLNVRKKGYDYIIDGSEEDKRELLVHSFYFKDVDDYFNRDENSRFFNFSIMDIISCVNNSIEETQIYISDIYQRNLVMIIGVALQRVFEGNYTEKVSYEFHDKAIEVRLIDEVLQKISERDPDIQIPENEKKYLYNRALTLIQNKDYISMYMESHHEVKNFRNTVEKIFKETLEKYKIQYDISNIIEGFATHVFYLIIRAKNKMVHKNDITSSLRHTHPYAYEVAVYLASQLETSFGIKISNDEIGLLAIYVGPIIESDASLENRYLAKVVLVCPKYNGLDEQLKERLSIWFKTQIRIVGMVRSYIELSEFQEEYDFAISTLCKEITVRDVVYVSPLIGAREFEKIETKIASIQKTRNIMQMEEYFRRFFDPEYFFYRDDLENGEEVVKMITAKMEEDGIVSDRYYPDVLKRESLASTAFFNKFAIPHSLDVKSNVTKLAYYYSEKPINWFESGSKVNLVLLLCNKEYDQEFAKIYEFLFELLTNSEMFLAMRKCRTYDELIEFALNAL